MKRVSRRELGQLAAGIAAASALPLDAQVPAPAPAQSTYIGPLTGVRLYFAYVLIDPPSPSGIRLVSNPWGVTIR